MRARTEGKWRKTLRESWICPGPLALSEVLDNADGMIAHTHSHTRTPFVSTA